MNFHDEISTVKFYRVFTVEVGLFLGTADASKRIVHLIMLYVSLIVSEILP